MSLTIFFDISAGSFLCNLETSFHNSDEAQTADTSLFDYYVEAQNRLLRPQIGPYNVNVVVRTGVSCSLASSRSGSSIQIARESGARHQASYNFFKI